MNITSHPVAPEQIMAFFDGELPAAEAYAVSAHLASCSACADLAEQFRSTSQWLSRWEVGPVPARLQASVQKLAATRKRAPTLSRLWDWELWNWGLLAAGGGGFLAAAFIAVAIFLFSSSATSRRGVATFEQAENGAALSDHKADRYLGAGPEWLAATAKMKQAASGVAAAEPKEASNVKSEGLMAALTSAPMVARTVSMVIVVKDFAASRAALDAILARHHGYAAQLNVTTPENGARAFNASLRIPAPELVAALAECKSLGRVEYENQSGEEVTQQHTDLLARLHNARETEERFRAILAQRTGKVSDVLEVEESIARVRGEIESMEGKQQALEHRVDFATVDIQLTEQYRASLDAHAGSVATRLHNALIAGYNNASATVLGIILFFAEYGPALLIWLVILGVPAWLLWRRRRRTRA